MPNVHGFGSDETKTRIFATTKTTIQKGVIRKLRIFKDLNGTEYKFINGKLEPQHQTAVKQAKPCMEIRVTNEKDASKENLMRTLLLLQCFFLAAIIVLLACKKS